MVNITYEESINSELILLIQKLQEDAENAAIYLKSEFPTRTNQDFIEAANKYKYILNNDTLYLMFMEAFLNKLENLN
jgi:hypothetical protein